ncbi:hypothetical protein ACTHGU_07015 [Chitinophagaceae bacterium MMS25-I14]
MQLRITLFSLLLLYAFSSSAQHTYTFFMDSTARNIEHSYCDRLHVADMRSDQKDLGYLRTGAFNRLTPIETEQSLDKLLSSYFTNNIHPTSADHYELLLVLYDMHMEDRPNGDELGTFYFNGDFFQGNEGRYKMVAHIDSIFEVRSGWDVSKDLINLSRKKTGHFIANAAAATASGDKTYTLGEAKLKRKTDNEQYPIYNTGGSFKKGIYLTMNDFINNTPLDTPFVSEIYFNSGVKQYAYHYQKPNGHKGSKIHPDELFAIYDGQQWTISNKYYFTKMKYENGAFITQRYFKGLANNAGAAAMFGLIGVIATSGNQKGTGLYEAHFDPELKDFVPFKRIL